MASIFDLWRGRGSKPLSLESANEMLRKAEAGVADAQAYVEQCKTDLRGAILDEREAARPLDKVKKARRTLSEAREALETALENLELSQGIQADAAIAEAAANRAATIDKLAALREARDGLAVKLSGALTEATKHYRGIIALGIEAESLGIPIPKGGTMSGLMELRRKLSNEIYRLGHDTKNPDKSFPGGAYPDFNHIDNPGAILPFDEECRNGTAHLLGILKGGE